MGVLLDVRTTAQEGAGWLVIMLALACVSILAMTNVRGIAPGHPGRELAIA